jgi:hypothetical protein
MLSRGEGRVQCLPRAAAWDLAGMDVATLARGQAVNRVLFGTALLLAPGRIGRLWVGPLAGDRRAKVLARAVGARDLTLGAGGLAALSDGDRGWTRRLFAAQAFADAADLVAILLARRELPRVSRVVGGTLAAGSAAVAGMYAQRVAR